MPAIDFLLVGTALAVAYANGANDNFKGVATLYGGGTLSYGQALSVATVATLLGSLASLYLAAALLKAFHGAGLVPASLAGSERFVLATGVAAALTVLFAALIGMPISTTHALIGGMLGAALASGAIPKWTTLDHSFTLPLLFSPLAVIPVTGAAYFILIRMLPAGLPGNDACLCVDNEVMCMPTAPGVAALAIAMPALTVASEAECRDQHADAVIHLNVDRGLDWVHVLSGAAVSFARGVNDTPKMAALLVLAPLAGAHNGVVLIALAIALGGLLNARRVAHIMSQRITTLDPRRGLAANMATAFMVLLASRWGLPVSTTHVSCGALFGVGALSGKARWRVVNGIVAAWIVTLPVAGLLGAAAILASRWI